MTQKQRTKKTSFFLFLLFFLLFVNISSFVAAQQTYSWDTATIDATWLDVQVGEFNDKSSGDGSGRLNIRKTVAVHKFRNEGQIETSEDGTIVWKSYVEFKLGMSFYTDVLPSDAIEGDFNYNVRRKYATIWAFEGVRYPLRKIDDPQRYNSLNRDPLYISWNTVKIDKLLPHDYDGNIPITVSIQEDFEGQSFNINGYTIKNVDIMPEIRDVIAEDYKIDTIGEYTDKYTNNLDDINKETDTIEVTTDNLPDGIKNDASETVKDQLKTLGYVDIGPRRKGQNFPGTTDTGQSAVKGASSGEWDNPSTESTDSMTFNFDFRLKPEIYYETQTITWKKCEQINWDYDDGWLSPSGVWLKSDVKTRNGAYDDYNPRIASVHVNNKWLYQEFLVRCNFQAAGELVGSHDEDQEIEDPALEIGDFIWQANYGEDSSDIHVPTNPWNAFLNFLSNPFGLIMFIVIIISIVAIIGIAFFKFSPVNFIMRFIRRGD